jgi:hypothetical protein
VAKVPLVAKKEFSSEINLSSGKWRRAFFLPDEIKDWDNYFSDGKKTVENKKKVSNFFVAKKKSLANLNSPKLLTNFLPD